MARSTPCSDRRGEGFTILELLVVMGIVSVLMGLSFAALTRVGKGPAVRVAEREVRTALAQARSASREQSAIAEVIFVPGSPSLIRLSMTRAAGSWHFDDPGGMKTLGGRNTFARLEGAQIKDGGTVRSCAGFDGNDKVVCDASAGYDPTSGFDLSLDVWPDKEHEGAQLFSFGEAFSLTLNGDGSLEADLGIQGVDDEITTVKTASGVVAPGAWARVGLTFDGIDIVVRAHGVIEARKRILPKNERLPRKLEDRGRQGRLTFGSKAFKGYLDEVLYLTTEDEEVTELANGQDVAFDLQAPLPVRFDADGRLDPRIHDGVVVIPIRGETESRQVRVDLTGVMR